MNRGDTISVLICVHSRDELHDRLFERALWSLERQTYGEFQVVVMLDECHIGTSTMLEKVRRSLSLDIQHYARPKKEGLAAAKNAGLKRCTGKWVMYLDADDEYMDCKVETQVRFMIANPSVDFCFTQAFDRDENGKLRPNCFEIGQYKTHRQISSRLHEENVLCHGSACIRKSAIDNLNGYDTRSRYLGMEDWHLWLRALHGGYRFHNIPERLYIYSLGTSVER